METTAGVKTTVDHEEIRTWVSSHGGIPAQVKGTSGGEDENATGALRIHFPNAPAKESLEEISWQRFFDKFERGSYEMEYQEAAADYSDVISCRLKKRTSVTNPEQAAG